MYYFYKTTLLFGLLAAVAHADYITHEEHKESVSGGGFEGGFESGHGGGFEGGQGGGYEGGQGGALESSHGGEFAGGFEGGLEGGHGGGIEAGSLGGGEHHEEHHDYYSPPHYKYEYSVHDPHTGDIKSHHESRVGDHVKGYYTLHESDGTIREVHYTADKHNGFNAEVKRIGHAHHAPVYGHHEHHV